MTTPDTPDFAAATWRKSSYSGGGNNCVEVAPAAAVGVRDSKNPTGGQLTFEADVWQVFISDIKTGKYQL